MWAATRSRQPHWFVLVSQPETRYAAQSFGNRWNSWDTPVVTAATLAALLLSVITDRWHRGQPIRGPLTHPLGQKTRGHGTVVADGRRQWATASTIIDCPPPLGQLTINALTAADLALLVMRLLAAVVLLVGDDVDGCRCRRRRTGGTAAADSGGSGAAGV